MLHRNLLDRAAAQSTSADQRINDAFDAVHKLTGRVDRMEPRIDDSLKELAYTVEGTEARIKAMHPMLTTAKRDLVDLQSEMNTALGGIEKLKSAVQQVAADKGGGQDVKATVQDLTLRISTIDHRLTGLNTAVTDVRTVAQNASATANAAMTSATAPSSAGGASSSDLATLRKSIDDSLRLGNDANKAAEDLKARLQQVEPMLTKARGDGLVCWWDG